MQMLAINIRKQKQQGISYDLGYQAAVSNPPDTSTRQDMLFSANPIK